jgi:predicted transcriptional regulator
MYAEKYQWIKGEKSGKIETYASHDLEWVYFQGGSRIGVNVMPEFMIQVDANSAFNLEITKQPKDFPIKQVQRPQEVIQKPREDFNPVKTLIKQAAKEKLTCKYEFEIQIPKTNVYNLIKDSFESDIDKDIIDIVMSSIDKNQLYKNIQEQIKEQTLKFYNNGSTRTETTMG